MTIGYLYDGINLLALLVWTWMSRSSIPRLRRNSSLAQRDLILTCSLVIGVRVIFWFDDVTYLMAVNAGVVLVRQMYIQDVVDVLPGGKTLRLEVGIQMVLTHRHAHQFCASFKLPDLFQKAMATLCNAPHDEQAWVYFRQIQPMPWPQLIIRPDERDRNMYDVRYEWLVEDFVRSHEPDLVLPDVVKTLGSEYGRYTWYKGHDGGTKTRFLNASVPFSDVVVAGNGQSLTDGLVYQCALFYASTPALPESMANAIVLIERRDERVVIHFDEAQLLAHGLASVINDLNGLPSAVPS